MHKTARIFFLVAILIAPLKLSAQAGSGADLLVKCEAAKEFAVTQDLDRPHRYVDSTYCLGLLQGILDTESLHKIMESEQLLCLPPEGMQVQQAVYIVVKYLEDHPEDLHKNQTLLAMAALMEAAPCAN